MTLKHTPGPWTTDVHGFIYAAPDSELPERTNQGASIVVAKVLKHSSGRPIANARLISAAPILLEAAKRLVETHNCEDFATPPCEHCLFAYAAIAMAEGTQIPSRVARRAAIRKATGG